MATPSRHPIGSKSAACAVANYKGSGKLDGMTALITGGDSGIGRAVAVLFAREGADVAIVYLGEHKDAKVTKAAVEAEGRRCVLVSGDVKDPAFCTRAVAKCVKALGGLDVLVNNAAFQLHQEALEDVSEEHLQETLQTSIGWSRVSASTRRHRDRSGHGSTRLTNRPRT